MTDNEIIKALESEIYLAEYVHSDYCSDVNLEIIKSVIKSAHNLIIRQQSEIERLQNAYKQCAWERDIFAEDMKEEIKKDCSYLMLDIKTIKSEAYKECIEKVKSEIDNKEGHIEEDYALRGCRDKKYFYDSEIEDILDNLVKEMIKE